MAKLKRRTIEVEQLPAELERHTIKVERPRPKRTEALKVIGKPLKFI